MEELLAQLCLTAEPFDKVAVILKLIIGNFEDRRPPVFDMGCLVDRSHPPGGEFLQYPIIPQDSGPFKRDTLCRGGYLETL